MPHLAFLSSFEIMAKRFHGGYGQRMAQMEEEEEKPDQSHLASKLMGLWSWGQMSAPLVQALAKAACDDGLQHPHVVKLSKIGSQGKFAGNMQRDLLIIAGDYTKLKCTDQINIRLKQSNQPSVSETVPLTFLLPHKLFAGLFHSLQPAFVSSVLGGDNGNIAKFWAAMKDHPFLRARPHLQQRPDLAKVVPIAIHGDGVNYMRIGRASGKSLEVLSWSSLLSQGATKHTNFLMFLLVKSLAKDTGVDQSWPRIWKILTWSLQALSLGLWPMKNWDGHDFPADSEDFQKRGTALADGFAAVLFVLRADLDFLSNHFGLNSAASNTPCALCKADRDIQSRPWTDCRPTAGWRATIWNAADWSAEHPTCHPLLRMPGAGLDLVSPDLMHCKHLGTDQLLIGSVLIWLIKHFMRGTVAHNLQMVWSFIQSWYKDLYGGK